jgi:hypothetical protein
MISRTLLEKLSILGSSTINWVLASSAAFCSPLDVVLLPPLPSSICLLPPAVDVAIDGSFYSFDVFPRAAWPLPTSLRPVWSSFSCRAGALSMSLNMTVSLMYKITLKPASSLTAATVARTVQFGIDNDEEPWGRD